MLIIICWCLSKTCVHVYCMLQWVIPGELYGLMDEFFISNQSKHTDLRENLKEKNHG